MTALVGDLMRSLDPDAQLTAAKQATGKAEPDEKEIAATAKALLNDAVKPIIASPKFRLRAAEIRKEVEQIIDIVTPDQVTRAEWDRSARDRAQALVKSFEQFIATHKDQITALQVLYSRPYKQRLHYAEIKELATAIKRPGNGFRRMEPDQLWQAYEQLDRSKVRGSGERPL
jgi:type I restriction enzyme R subunit